MARTLAVFVLATVLVGAAWLRLEQAPWPLAEPLVVSLLALLPALAIALGRSRLVAGAVLAGSTLVASSLAFDIPLSQARIGDRDTDFLDPILAAFSQGMVEFFATRVPFDRLDFPLMHGVVLLAVFAFVALAAAAAAARRSLLAAITLAVGVVWPATINESWASETRPLLTGAVTLAAVLATLFLVREGGRPARGALQAAGFVLLLVVASVAASSSDAVAKTGFVNWQTWSLGEPREKPVSVRYVWDSDYEGISYPPKKTVVLRVRVPGPRESLYWRATTLDEYSGTHWNEELRFDDEGDRSEETIELAGADALLPRRAQDDSKWVRQDVEVVALRDTHLVGAAQPMRWRPAIAPVQAAQSGILVSDAQLRQGQRYTVWSYVPRAKPSELARSPADYPAELERYLRLTETVELPEWGTPDRPAELERVLAHDPYIGTGHLNLYERARQVVGDAETPYDAVVALEAWFRSDGGFVYDESPPSSYLDPPLVPFVLRDKRGYCQHFAGAMAVMLRLLGIPSRVAAGFTSGSYDEEKHEWTVTDHNAHTWVEVYFPRIGWIPFDPTPNRGQLTAAYTPFSTAFDARDAALALRGGAASTGAVQRQLDRSRASEENFDPGEVGAVGGSGEDQGASLLGLLALLVAGAVALVLFLKAARRHLRFVSRDPRTVATSCRRDLVAFLVDQGFDPPASATLAELGEFVQEKLGANASAFVSAATAARFARERETRGAAGRARRELSALRRAMRARLTLAERARGALSVRSLAV